MYSNNEVFIYVWWFL